MNARRDIGSGGGAAGAGGAARLKAFLHERVPMTGVDWLVDCVIAAGAFGFGVLQLSLFASLFVPDRFTQMMLGIHTAGPSTEGVFVTLLMCLPLVARRRFPWPVFAATLALWLVFEWGIGAFSLSAVAPLIALFTVAYERGGSQAFVAGGVTLAAMFLSSLGGLASSLSMLMLLQNVTLAAAVTLAGYALHARQDYLEAAEARAVEAERLRESEARRAAEAERTRESEASRRVEEERVRIAREVHDITAHSLSAVSIQAAAAERLVDVDPAAAKEAIAQVRATAKGSLEDMRAMIGVLRGGASEPETAPVEGTERMGDLVDYLERANIASRLDEAGYERKRVPSHIDVALFGIAREACTNIVRHSGAAHAAMTLATDGDVARLVVEDDGRGFGLGADLAAGGHGIEGMRERARLLGGAFEAGASAAGGARIEVGIPL